MRYNIALVGAGFMGRMHAACYAHPDLDSRITYIVDTDSARAAALATSLPWAVGVTDSYQQVLDDPTVDAVDLCTPTPYHYPGVLQAARAGKHVLCEKPIALDEAQAEEMVAACRQAGVVFMVGHVLRFWPEYVAAAELLQTRNLGAVRHLACTRLSPPPASDPQHWMRDSQKSGGAVFDLAIHDFDLIHWFAGTPTSVAAVGDLQQFSAIFTLPSGGTARVDASMAMPPGFPFHMAFRITTEHGVVEFTGEPGQLRLVEGGQETLVTVPDATALRQADTSAIPEGYQAEIAHFLECVRTGKPPERAKPEDAVHALRLALQVEAALAIPAVCSL